MFTASPADVEQRVKEGFLGLLGQGAAAEEMIRTGRQAGAARARSCSDTRSLIAHRAARRPGCPAFATRRGAARPPVHGTGRRACRGRAGRHRRPAGPEPPASITRDDRRRATVRAIRLDRAAVRWTAGSTRRSTRATKPFGGFIQVAPQNGAPRRPRRTDVWIIYDAEQHLRRRRACWDSAPPERVGRQRDAPRHQPAAPERHFGVMFDTFHDRRNGFMFYTNPLGALADYSVVDEGDPNTDWNPVWRVAHRPLRRRLDRRDGDSVQVAALPLRRRTRSGASSCAARSGARTSGRTSRRCRRTSAGPQALNRVSSGGTLVGLDLPPASKNIELKPYAISRVDDRSTCACRRRRNDFDPDVGGDVKYGVTANLTADFTDQHRLRAGRGGRAAGEPDALQPVLSREARLLPRGARHLRLRAAAARGGGGSDGSEAPPTRPTCSTAGASASTATASFRSTSAAG